MKSFVAILLVIGLLSPMCLCGAVVSGGHGAVVCDGAHGHSHGNDGEKPAEDSEHDHAHTDFRVLTAGAVTLPSVPASDLAEWAVGFRFSEPRGSDFSPPVEGWPDETRLSRSDGTAPAVTGVFRL